MTKAQILIKKFSFKRFRKNLKYVKIENELY